MIKAYIQPQVVYSLLGPVLDAFGTGLRVLSGKGNLRIRSRVFKVIAYGVWLLELDLGSDREGHYSWMLGRW